jgi:hypothetical protein
VLYVDKMYSLVVVGVGLSKMSGSAGGGSVGTFCNMPTVYTSREGYRWVKVGRGSVGFSGKNKRGGRGAWVYVREKILVKKFSVAEKGEYLGES